MAFPQRNGRFWSGESTRHSKSYLGLNMNQGFVCDNSDILRCLSCTRDPVWGMLLELLLLRGPKSNTLLEAGLSQGFIQSGLGNLLRTEPAQPWGSCPTAWLFPQWGFILSSVSIVSPLRPHCPFSSSPRFHLLADLLSMWVLLGAFPSPAGQSYFPGF